MHFVIFWYQSLWILYGSFSYMKTAYVKWLLCDQFVPVEVVLRHRPSTLSARPRFYSLIRRCSRKFLQASRLLILVSWLVCLWLPWFFDVTKFHRCLWDHSFMSLPEFSCHLLAVALLRWMVVSLHNYYSVSENFEHSSAATWTVHTFGFCLAAFWLGWVPKVILAQWSGIARAVFYVCQLCWSTS